MTLFPCKPGKINSEATHPNARERKVGNELTPGAERGLRRGLGPGLIVITSGALEVLVGGSSPVEVLALFAILYANVSMSLQRQAKTRSSHAR